MHNDETNLAEQVASTLKRASDASLLTDAMVSAATTKDALKTAIQGVATHNADTNFKIQLAHAVDYLTDADISGSTTVAALIATTGIASPSSSTILE